MRIAVVPTTSPGLGYVGRTLMAGAGLALGCAATTEARAQAPSPAHIPLELLFTDSATFPPQYRLGINVGINGGAPRLYLFDTGSALFNAAYTQSMWPGLTPSTNASTGNTPVSTVANGNGVTFCYGNGSSGCRGYQGNIVQANTLNFYTPGASPTLATSLSASQGYQVNAVYNQLVAGAPTLVAGTTTPIQEGVFYGVFGAGDFTTLNTGTGYAAGSVLGQTTVSNAKQGYVVSANGQTNPVTGTTNPPQQSNGQNVLLGGNPTLQAVTTCSPCVTLGLTPQVMGQFAPVNPGPATTPTGLVPWSSRGPASFVNPYGGATGNNASSQFGVKFNVTLAPSTVGETPLTSTASALLDTGTGGLTLSTIFMNQPGIGDGTGVLGGVTLTATGLTGDGSPIAGLASSSSILQQYHTNPITYTALFDQNTPGTTNTLGLSFFLQNSVLFDLDNQMVGYTPFFVTDANLSTNGGPLIVDNTNVPLGLAGVISGAGGIHIQDGGQVQLSATNTYTGRTKIDTGGQLNIAGPGSIAGSSGVTNNGTFDISRAWNTVSIQDLSGGGQIYLGAGKLTVTNANNSTFSGTIADSGGAYDVAGGKLELTGGTLTLTGVNSYSGGTIVNSGATLAIQADSGLGAASGGLTLDGGSLKAKADLSTARTIRLDSGGGIFDTNGFNVVLGTAVTGTGVLVKNGLGMLTLSGANSYGGGTVVNDGILQLAPGASLPTTGALAVNGGTVDFNGNSVTVGSLLGLGGTIALGSGTLTVAEQGNTAFAGTLTGTGGLTMQGPGMLSLTGTNTYTGPTSVTGGRLAVNGSITSDVTVGAGGNLGGSGIIFGAVTNNGIASPGNSIGTLNVVGAYTQAAGSSYQVETNAAGQADRLNVTGAPGTATLAGGTVTLTAASGVYAPSTTYTILNAAGGVTGTYAGASSLYPFLQPSLAYDANNVYLTLKPGGFGAGAATPNQAAVGRVLDQSVAGSTGDLATVIGTMATYTQGQGQAAMNAISGQNYSGFATANVGNGLLFMNALGQQMAGVRSGRGDGARIALAEACAAETCDGERKSPWSAWATGMGGTGTVAGNANAGTVTYSAGGVATGFDYRLDPSLLVGAGIGFASGSQWVGGFSGQGSTNSYQASLFASFTPGAFYLDALAGYGYNDNQMTRQIVLPNLAARTAQGRAGANQFLGQAEAGYRMAVDERASASLTPFARFQATGITQAAFTESGAQALNLSVAQQTTSSVRTVLGAELAGGIEMGWTDKLGLQLRLGWAHEYADTARPTTAAFAGAPGQNFTVYGAAPLRDGITLGIGASTALAAGTSIYLRYDAEFSTGSSLNALTGGFRMTW